jgi:hypothetical protein
MLALNRCVPCHFVYLRGSWDHAPEKNEPIYRRYDRYRRLEFCLSPRTDEIAAIEAEFVSACVKVGLRNDNAAEMEEKVNVSAS